MALKESRSPNAASKMRCFAAATSETRLPNAELHDYLQNVHSTAEAMSMTQMMCLLLPRTAEPSFPSQFFSWFDMFCTPLSLYYLTASVSLK